MLNLNFAELPRILAPFDTASDVEIPGMYSKVITKALKKILPLDFFSKAPSERYLPLIFANLKKQTICNISFYFLMKSRPSAFKFFYEMISRWLVPGTRLNVLLVYNVDFRMPEIGEDLYNLCEVMIRVEDPRQLEQIKKNYPVLESELLLGLRSPYYAQKILEIKGLSTDEKAAFVQEQIAYNIERFPTIYDQTIFAEMQHVLMTSTDEFKACRECRHLSRIISIHYFFRKELRTKIQRFPNQRHHQVKIFQIKVGPKTVVGLLAGMTFLRDKELFEEGHFLKAIITHLPGVKAVENSYFAHRRGSELITTLYIEIEKINGEPITTQEINHLRSELRKDLGQHVEDLLPPVFMPRNEEEIMRHIVSLSNQIKYVRDLPQIVISYDNQTHQNLYFTVILVRLLTPDQPTIQELFEQGATFIEYIPDRYRKVGHLRKKYTKEATVFRVKFSKENFIRADHSIDLSKARHAIVSEITRLIGPIRDFNGGMISKQTELLSSLKVLLKQDGVRYSEWLLENFFYSLSPPSMRAVLEAKSLKILAVMMHAALNQKEIGTIRVNSNEEYVYVLITTGNSDLKEELNRVIQNMSLSQLSYVSTHINPQNTHYLGYIYHSFDGEERERFAQVLAASAAPALATRQ